jgi:predicted metal-binding protein
MNEVRSYQHGLLYQTISEIEDSFDIEGMQDAGRRHVLVSQRLEAFLMLELGKHLHLSCGGCRLCERCAKLDGLPCRDPERAMPSMEGYGIDVYNTCKPTELKYINGQNTVTYFGIVLY